MTRIMNKAGTCWIDGDVKREACSYSPLIELLTFVVTNGKTREPLDNIPFPVGTTDADLSDWLI